MKTKELINILQELDPSGEVQVCVGGVDINTVYRAAGFYDGYYQILERDSKGSPIGMKITTEGDKIVLKTLGAFSALEYNPKFYFDLSELKPIHAERFAESVELMKKNNADFHIASERRLFREYIVERVAEYIPKDDDDYFEDMAECFFDENLSPDDPFPDFVPEYNMSYVKRRELQWDKEIKIDFDGLDIKISKVKHES